MVKDDINREGNGGGGGWGGCSRDRVGEKMKLMIVVGGLEGGEEEGNNELLN